MHLVARRQMFWLSTLAVGLFGGILLVGMLSSSDSSATSSLAKSGTTTPDASPEASPVASPVASPTASVTIKISMMAFQTPSIEVEAGTAVTWVNEDVVAHTVTNRPTSGSPLFDSGYLQSGDSWTYTFEEPGRYDYYCIPHPFMTGTITVHDR